MSSICVDINKISIDCRFLFVAKREILFLDSLRPDGFGDETYRTIFRLRLKIINLLALFQACYLVIISKRSLVLRLQVHIRAFFSGFKFIFESHS